jgi:hypothetical protein
LQEQKRRLDDLRRQIKRASSKPAAPVSDQAQDELRGGQAPRGQSQSQQQQAETPPATVGQAPEPAERPPEVAPLGRQAGVLTPRGVLILEPSLQYSYSTNDRVAIVGFSVIPAIIVGLIDVRTVSRSAWVAALTARYGITDRLEVEWRIPWVYRRDSTIARPFDPAVAESAFNADGSGIGDVELSARYQFNEGGMEKPYFVGTLRYKSRTGKDPFEVERVDFVPNSQLEAELPTGSGFEALQPGLTVLYPTDPAVFFLSVLYLHNFERDVAGVGRIDPGDVPEFNFGMGLALNERASFSLGYDHAIIQKAKVNGAVLPLAQTIQIGQLAFGYSYKLSARMTLNASVALGVTGDAPDVQLTLRLPIRTF